MAHQYHRSFDPQGQDSLAKLARLVRPGSLVLDVGCGPGVLAAYLSEHRACYVDGIEGDAASAQQGARFFRSLWVADLESEDPATLVAGARYDAIICADILEHLREPERLLRHLMPLLKDDGELFLSVPNVAHAGLIAELLGGELRYRDEGLLDRTHIHFFTRDSLLRLLDACGLRVYSFDTVRLPVEQSEFDPAALQALDEPVRARLLASEDAETYQFIVSCAPRAATLPIPTPVAVPVVPKDVPVDVIVPVYAGLEETRACLTSVLAAPVSTAFELVIVDDCGPDQALRDWLRELAADPRVSLLANEENLGFVASINRGIGLHPERDVVLLNSDTEVANDWLDRLRNAAYAEPDIGTVTPFANSGATICAYPLFCRDNPLPDGWEVAALDALMRNVNAGAGVDLPTAVGYCTYIRRDCLDDVGVFDEATFGRGYGEESDFCMRARYQGWRHRLAADVFVFHVGGVSFGPEKSALVEAAQQAVRERHPAYELLVAEHVQQDPARDLRERVDWQRLARSPRRRLLLISHALGGGVQRHVRELAQWLEPEAEVLVLQPEGDDGLALSWLRRTEAVRLGFARHADDERLIALLKALRIERVHVQHLIGMQDVARQILADLGAPYDLTVHDFRPICPRINLIDSAGHFCDQPPEPVCDRCLARDMDAASTDIAAWRREQHAWLAEAERVLVPSQDTAARLCRVWPNLNVLVAPHDQLPEPVVYPPAAPRRWHADAPLRVVVVGQLSDVKGLGLLVACARDAAARQLPLELHLIGHPLGPVPSLAEAPLTVHGAYREEDLLAKLRNLAPHLAWFPARWPETWSYTLTTCMQAGLLVAAPALGAFVERLAAWRWALALPPDVDAVAVNDALLDFAAQHLSELNPPGPFAVALDHVAAEFDYRAEYLVPRHRPPLVVPEGLSRELLDGRTPRARPFAVVQSSGQPLVDQLVRFREENYALRGGVADRDALIARQLSDAARGWGELAEHRAERAGLLGRATEAEDRRHDAERQLQNTEHRLRLSEGERQAIEQQLRAVGDALQRRDAEIETIYGSLSWKLSRPVRGAGRAVRALRQGAVASVQPLWHRLPVPGSARYRIKGIAFRSLGPLVRGTRAYAAWLEQARWIEQGTHALQGPERAFPSAPVVEDLRIEGGVASDPVVSIIIPVHNQLDYTLACLDSVAKQLPATPIEVLIVDDCSNDDTETRLSVRDDIRYLRNAANLGFVGSCNHGATQARGEYLFFLNNDTLVLEGWLDHLVATFSEHEDVGLVGSKLIYADGRLQEAGGILWADASGWNWGRRADPAAPEYNFVRDVDYCSGAALMIRRALFDDLGGFDQRYAPAYYEDTDLAFAVRARGLRVLYQPLSQIVHYEGVSAGTDLNSGMKAYQVRNRELFLDKWRGVLAGHGFDWESKPPRLSADRRPRARMLVIDACTPTPDQDSGSLDMVNYLRMLNELGYRVTFIPESDLLHFGRYTKALQAIGVECLYHPFIDSVEQALETRGPEFDAVMLTRGPTAYRYIDTVRTVCPRAKVIFNTVDLHFLRERRRAKLQTGSESSAEAEEMRCMEVYVMQRADTTIVISSAERDLLATEAAGTRVRVIPLLRDIPGRSGGFEVREGIVFVGGFRHPPNIDAMLWFCSDIWPLIRGQLPNIELFIVGSHMVPEVQALGGDGVHVLGYVEDIEPLFARVRLSVAPLRFGAGQKGKVVTSLSYGVPCVLTNVASEGLALAENVGALCGETPKDFAAAVVRVYTDASLWSHLSDAGLDHVRREFSVAANRRKLSELLGELGLPA